MAPHLRNRLRQGTSGRKMAIMIADILHSYKNNGNDDDSNNGKCTFKHFNTCHPPKFSGEEGATTLLQGFESMEVTFTNCGCPENLRTQYSTSMFHKGALTWWNGEKN